MGLTAGERKKWPLAFIAAISERCCRRTPPRSDVEDVHHLFGKGLYIIIFQVTDVAVHDLFGRILTAGDAIQSEPYLPQSADSGYRCVRLPTAS